jgi:hypothetical protein
MEYESVCPLVQSSELGHLTPCGAEKEEGLENIMEIQKKTRK